MSSLLRQQVPCAASSGPPRGQRRSPPTVRRFNRGATGLLRSPELALRPRSTGEHPSTHRAPTSSTTDRKPAKDLRPGDGLGDAVDGRPSRPGRHHWPPVVEAAAGVRSVRCPRAGGTSGNHGAPRRRARPLHPQRLISPRPRIAAAGPPQGGGPAVMSWFSRRCRGSEQACRPGCTGAEGGCRTRGRTGRPQASPRCSAGWVRSVGCRGVAVPAPRHRQELPALPKPPAFQGRAQRPVQGAQQTVPMPQQGHGDSSRSA